MLVSEKVDNSYIWEQGNVLLFLSDVHLKIFSLRDNLFPESSRILLKYVYFVPVLH